VSEYTVLPPDIAEALPSPKDLEMGIELQDIIGDEMAAEEADGPFRSQT
jgi:hypothetical protein